MTRTAAPRLAITVSDPAGQPDPALATRKVELYATALARHGAQPILVHTGLRRGAVAEAFASMDGLVLGGGPDLDPSRYGRTRLPTDEVDPARDELETEAWQVASERALPVLGVCRGMQAINVFSGGSLLQHVDGHAGPPWGTGRAVTHPFRVEPGTRLARILFPANPRGGVLEVNTYHHQAIRPEDVAPGLVPNARASSAAGELVEGLETRSGRFVLGVQCHPERADSTPKQFDRLFAFFVDAARGPAVVADPTGLRAVRRR